MSAQEVCALDWGAAGKEERLTISDEDSLLVDRFLRGDASAFDALFARYQDYVYHIVYGITGSAEESRDLTQDVFLLAYKALPRFRRGSRFATWLYRIAMNRAVDATRSARKWRFLPIPEDPFRLDQPVDASLEPESALEQKLDRDQIQQTLMRCPVLHRQVLALRYFRDLSVEEIAETMGCSIAAAKVRLHRARHVFRARYLEVHPELAQTCGKETADAASTLR